MTKSRDYHHGNLRQALIDAGIEILDETGWRGLTLRACASRAGVSHAAPAHHFGNLMGLQTALATLAFQRFRQEMQDAIDQAPADNMARLRAASEGYIRFARGHTGLFLLMFGGAELDRRDQEFRDTQDHAYDLLGSIIQPFLSPDDPDGTDQQLRLALWSAVHGYAHLLISGTLNMLPVSEDGLSHLPDFSSLVDRKA